MYGFALFLFIALIVGPVVLAWSYGEKLLDHFTTRRRDQVRKRRRRSTQALPIREEAIDSLLGAERKREAIEDRIGEALSAFRQTDPVEVGNSDLAETALEEIEQAVLHRESRFSAYLDCAWMQSETIELLTREAELLRTLADLPKGGFGSARNRPPRPQRKRFVQSPTEKLLDNLRKAVEKRAGVDLKLQTLRPRSDPNAESAGTNFDASIDNS